MATVRSRNLYQPASSTPFKISRSKIDLFVQCPRCFFLDRRLGIKQPPIPQFTLNSAVDTLLKKEFDTHRAQGTAHPLMKAYGVSAIPFMHNDLHLWRANFVGVQFHHQPTNLIITGAVDDVWINDQGELHVVDYKATAKDKEIELEDTAWHNQYRRQIEVYQWLLRQNGFLVSDMGYFVYVNGQTDREAFDGKLDFDVKLIPYSGNDKWVEQTIMAIYNCLVSETIPPCIETCDYCQYFLAVSRASAGIAEVVKPTSNS